MLKCHTTQPPLNNIVNNMWIYGRKKFPPTYWRAKAAVVRTLWTSNSGGGCRPGSSKRGHRCASPSRAKAQAGGSRVHGHLSGADTIRWAVTLRWQSAQSSTTRSCSLTFKYQRSRPSDERRWWAPPSFASEWNSRQQPRPHWEQQPPSRATSRARSSRRANVRELGLPRSPAVDSLSGSFTPAFCSLTPRSSGLYSMRPLSRPRRWTSLYTRAP